ncbi:hypothetical protein [Stenoxybacter acetivorans]|uniref:ApeP family dehydratase n=1 Tax=Stenoxybacter acetivorans TaxID=422441 RepID=UPI000563CEC0|nr:hypothetical protein [Stenoxybacter acetivorans]
MLPCPITRIAPLLPHSGNMVLLDRILSYDETGLCAAVCLRNGHPLQQADGTIPAWMGMELLAQCIGALEGCFAQEHGQAIRLGFLLGTRRLNLLTQNLPLNRPLIADVHLSIRDQNGFAVFDCRLYESEYPLPPQQEPPNLLIQAALNVFSPPNLDTYLQSA